MANLSERWLVLTTVDISLNFNDKANDNDKAKFTELTTRKHSYDDDDIVS